MLLILDGALTRRPMNNFVQAELNELMRFLPFLFSVQRRSYRNMGNRKAAVSRKSTNMDYDS